MHRHFDFHFNRLDLSREGNSRKHGAALGLTRVTDPFGTPIYGDTVRSPGFLAGGQIGYNWQVPGSAWVFGVEADAAHIDGDCTATCFAISSTIVSSPCRARPRHCCSNRPHRLCFRSEWAHADLWQGRFLLGQRRGRHCTECSRSAGCASSSTRKHQQSYNVSVSQSHHEVKLGVNYKSGMDPWASDWNLGSGGYPIKAAPPSSPAWRWEIEEHHPYPTTLD